LGYDFGRLRGELSWVRRQATIDDAGSSWTVGPFRPSVSRDSPKVSSNSGFASLYLDLPVSGTRLIPYLGGGLGVTALQTSPTTIQLRRFSSTFGGSGKLPAYQAKLGLAYRSSPRTDLFAEAVFQGSPSRSQGSLERSPLINWGLRFGLRWRFGGPVKAPAPVATPRKAGGPESLGVGPASALQVGGLAEAALKVIHQAAGVADRQVTAGDRRLTGHPQALQ